MKSNQKEITELISYENFEKHDLFLRVAREFFEFLAEYNLTKEGIDFFEQFPFFIKNQKFNSIKTFLFYFAYQSKRYTSPMVKELLSQQLLNAKIVEPKIYLDFCMYCFFKGLYYIEKKNFFMATYLYCAALRMGLKNVDALIFNEYSIQMLRALCFLRELSDFDINEFLFGSSSYKGVYEGKIGDDDIDECLSYLKKGKIDLETYNMFIKMNSEIYKDYKLIGLKNLAKDEIMLKIIKENLKIYKRIKLTKLAEITNIEFNYLLKIIKKKCIEGELNVKYDEESDILEVFDLDLGMKENVKKTQDLYKKIIEGTKDYFINLRDNKLKELNNEGAQNINMINMINQMNSDDDDIGGDDDDVEPMFRRGHFG